MKKKIALLLTMSMVFGLVACGAEEEKPVEPEKIVEEKPVEEAVVSDEPESKDGMYEAYEKAVRDLVDNHVFPGGEEADFLEDMDMDISANTFAVYDVDLDGKKELIIEYSTSTMAGMVEHVYGYDEENDQLFLELTTFPGASFYANGLVQTQASHNHSKGMNLWPYGVSTYNKDTDSYDFVISVSSWDKEVADTDEQGEPYPEDVDFEGFGTVYILDDGEGETLMGVTEYEDWYSENLGLEDPLYIPFLNMSEEHISQIAMSDVDRAEKSYAIVEEYGFENGFSALSYRLLGNTMVDCGDYYQIDAVFLKGITVPANMQAGDTYSIVVDELSNVTEVVEFDGEFYHNLYTDAEYYTYDPNSDDDVYLYCDSDDRVEAKFFVGVLRIAKDARVGIAIENKYWNVEAKDLNSWYNGVKFAEDGMVTELVNFGD